MRLLALLGAFLLFASTPLWAIDIPASKGYVTDNAALLSPSVEANLERFLAGFERSDSTQIVVLTVPNLAGEDVASYALKVAESWKIGQKGGDNGALLLIAKDERKVRIEVGYGLEGRLTDLLAGRIIDNEITPYFRQEDFNNGISAGVSAMVEAVRGEYQGTGSRRKPQGSPWGFLSLLLFAAPMMLLRSGYRSNYSHRRRSSFWIGGPPMGGGFGGGSFGGGGGFSGGGGGFGGGGASGGW